MISFLANMKIKHRNENLLKKNENVGKKGKKEKRVDGW